LVDHLYWQLLSSVRDFYERGGGVRQMFENSSLHNLQTN